jgi:hypothetical protein
MKSTCTSRLKRLYMKRRKRLHIDQCLINFFNCYSRSSRFDGERIPSSEGTTTRLHLPRPLQHRSRSDLSELESPQWHPASPTNPRRTSRAVTSTV